MKNMKFVDALRDGLREELIRDDKVFLFGECIGGEQGGSFVVTKGLDQEFGKQRVIETPLSEAAIAGTAVGAAAMGLRPVAEIMFGSLMTLVVDEVHNQAGTLYYLSGGKIKVPMVIRTCNWMRLVSGPHHCGNIDAMWMNSPGIKAVAPSCAADAKGLIKAAIRDDDPVIFLEYSPLYPIMGEVPDDPDYIVPIGKADIKREGSDVTVIAYATTVLDALDAAADLEKSGVSVEVLDLRTIIPYDKEAIKASVAKTGRVVIAYEGYKTGGVGAEISAFIAEECIEDLTAPIMRVACKDVPNPSNAILLEGINVGKKDILAAIRKVMG
ncbi:MAG: transketolase C-terminal domain-containing protein [Eubacteriales bacterium]|nr:transketolase C-terminal domain-containing protein [Eubacteriales bacterium]